MAKTPRSGLGAIALIVASSGLAACGGPPLSAGVTGSSGPGGSGAIGVPAPSSTLPVPTAAPSSGADWIALLSLVSCPTPRTSDPACLDANTGGDSPARTSVVKVGDEVRVSFSVDNAAAVISPPITLLLFTYEPPPVGSFLAAVDCGGCTITTRPEGVALEWPGVGPGDHALTVALRAIGHPTQGPGGAVKVGDDYEWLAGFFAEPTSQVLGSPDGIDTSTAFAVATGETTIRAR